MRGIRNIKGLVFIPTLLSIFFQFFGLQGHFHTFICEVKEIVRDLFFRVTPEKHYDERKLFTLSDGG